MNPFTLWKMFCGCSENKPMSEIPRDAKIVSLILKSIGIDECEPKVIQQFLEFMYRHTTQVLEEGMLFSQHAGREELNLDDVRLALQSKVNTSFVPPPPREVLLDLAARKNVKPLPLLEDEFDGLRLPSDQDSLLNPNYRITSLSQKNK